MSARAELGTLEASGLIEIAALQPELEYLFRHALVQEAAYASLLKQDRRNLHRAAAETIVALHPERAREMAGVVGMHYEQAGDTERAAEHLVIAGEHATEKFAAKEAVGFFVRAGTLASDGQVELRLRAAIGCAKAGWTYNQAGDDIARLERALEGREANPGLVAEAYFWLAFLRRQRGEVPETSPQLKEALDRSAEAGGLADGTAAALPRALMGSYIAFTGDLREGARQMREALDVIERKGDGVSTAIVGDFLAITLARLGDFDEAEKTIARAEGFAGDEIARVDVFITHSAVDLERGDVDKACVAARECTARAEDLGAYACVVASSVMVGAASLALDDAKGAKGQLERGWDLCLVTNMAPMRTLIQGMLGSARAQLGDLPGGIAGWDEALKNAREMSDRYGEAQTLWGRGRTYARQQNPDLAAALSDYDRAVELFESMDTRPALARALHGRSLVERALGREPDAVRDEARALQIGSALGLRDAPFA